MIIIKVWDGSVGICFAPLDSGPVTDALIVCSRMHEWIVLGNVCQSYDYKLYLKCI